MRELVSDPGSIKADDQYLDILGAGGQPDDETLTKILVSWRNEVRSDE